jgi:hypothetical protein
MALNNSQKAIVDRRRLAVAQLRLRGATQREIEEQLFAQGIVNPKTKKPWSLGTINADLAALSTEWQREALAEITELKGQQLAEIRAARRQSWQEKDMAQVRHLIKLEIDLLGTAEPAGIKVYDWQSDIVELLKTGKISADEVRAAYPDLAAQFFAKAGVDAPSDN